MSTKPKQEGDPANDGNTPPPIPILVDAGGLETNGESPEMWSSQQQQQEDGDDGSSGGGGRDSSTPSSKPEEGDISASSSDSSGGESLKGTATPSSSSSPQNLPQWQYSRDELLALKEAPLSVKWPSCLDPSYNKSPGRWDPERWIRAVHDERRPSSTASTGSTVTNNRPDRPPDLELKRSRDPRERVKQEEQDGLVLSPQRRSFSTGCHGLQQPPPAIKRPDSPTERPQRESHREIPARRIGSGRISRRDDLETPVPGERREIPRRDRDVDRDRDREREVEPRRDSRDWRSKPDQCFERDNRYENRRRFFEEEETDKRPERRDRDRRYQERRRMSSRNDEEEQPEWFTGGPTSQNEFIELVGFDDIPEEGNTSTKPLSKRERRRSKKDKDSGGSRKGSRSNTPVIVEDVVNSRSPKLQQEEHEVQNVGDMNQHQPQPTVIEPVDQELPGFNIDDYLGDIIGYPSKEIGSVPEEVMAANNASSGGSSRLKQFFSKRESPVLGSTSNSRRSSIDLPPHINNLLSVLDSNRFFAPISPADKTGGNSIVDLLQQATGGIGGPDPMGPPPPIGPPGIPGSQPPPSIKDLMMDGKGQSLEEVEAGIRSMRQPIHNHHGHMVHNHHNMNQMTAFDDFLSQVTSTQGTSKPDPKNSAKEMFMKLLNGGMKDGGGVVKPLPQPVQPALPNAPTENDLIAMFMKGSAGSPGQQQQNQPPPHQQTRSMPPPAVPNLNVPPPSMVTHYQPPPNMPQMPSQGLSTQDVVMKLFQVQQQQQQQKRQQQLLQQQQQQQQQLDPIKQLMGGLGRMSVTPSPQPQDQVLRDALMRPDVQNLLQRVASGHVTASQLVNQLKSGSITPSQRDAISTVLKFFKGQHSQPLIPHRTTLTPSPTPQTVVSGGLSLGGSNSLSPRVASPNPDSSNMLNPHILQQQSRLSPLMFTGGSLGNNLSVNNVGGGPRRPPSHQELVAHTQSIMQKALLKQELEKAKEKHRKREAERARSPNPNAPVNVSGIGSMSIPSNVNKDGSPSKSGVKSQSPLAFTPTSVMRKMTADRDRHERIDKPDSPVVVGDLMKDNDRTRDQLDNPVSVVAMQLQTPLQQQQVLGRGKVDNKRDMRRGASPLPPTSSSLSPGGPIMGGKGPMIMGGGNSGMMNMGHHNMGPPGQRHPSASIQPPNMGMSRGNQQNLNIRALQAAQAQAVLAQQLMRSQAPPSGSLGPPHHRMPSANPPGPLQQLLLNNNTPATSLHHHHKQDGGLHVPLMSMGGNSHRSSPVNLAQFFGRDIMSQVQAGGLPDLPGGKVLSLEEVERLQQTQAVPN
ncbi:uncharacterized protein LOC121854170 isoform X3 [Homarus americanus]|uniref:uncharacterized protein LOC121854170 isoform X3 n=1 Tax=Homarus americanus TaxID=6706 RepID=UPI001C4935B7|nr:uncharacterized protein LOC121854170 isoform X3 [Homarus americanus]